MHEGFWSSGFLDCIGLFAWQGWLEVPCSRVEGLGSRCFLSTKGPCTPILGT